MRHYFRECFVSLPVIFIIFGFVLSPVRLQAEVITTSEADFCTVSTMEKDEQIVYSDIEITQSLCKALENYHLAGYFSCDRAAVRYLDKWGYAYINPYGETVIPGPFIDALNFSDGLAAVKETEDGPWKYIDKDGNVIITLGLDEFPCSFSNGKAVIYKAWYTSATEEVVKYVRVIDRNGKVLANIQSPKFQYLLEWGMGSELFHTDIQIHDGKICIPSHSPKEGRYYSIYDIQGHYIADDDYSNIDKDAVNLDDIDYIIFSKTIPHGYDNYGVKDLDGNIVLEPKYSNIKHIYDDVHKVYFPVLHQGLFMVEIYEDGALLPDFDPRFEEEGGVAEYVGFADVYGNDTFSSLRWKRQQIQNSKRAEQR